MTPQEAIIFLQSRIELIDKYYPQVEDYREALDIAIKALEQQPKRGKWIKVGEWSKGFGMGEVYGWFYECSECSEQVKNGYGECSYNYCPYCGSDNGEEADE